ncbi:MAG: FprA family A-type flavoprotein, partial [Lachnospiraceae bacterium]|nr:FprA family A-type flavoprotein [Lachnospiraceae bacterium]
YIRTICPLHGPVLSGDISYYVEMYNTWSNYIPEEDGIMIAYTSVYGNTKRAVSILEEKLKDRGYKRVVTHDLARCDMSVAVADAFKYSKLVLATTTYNAELFPPMREFVSWLTERNYQKRLVGIIENGSWAPIAAKIIKEKMERCKGIVFTETTVRILSVPNGESIEQLEMLADELCRSY